MSAWRPYSNLVCGELDNTQRGKVTGWFQFAGMHENVALDLEGDFHRDIRGTVVKLSNPNPAEATPEYMKGFAPVQTGKVGDMTAGLEPVDYVNSPYFEWYSQNGRVVLEPERDQVQVVGTPRPWKEEQPISREEQQENMARFMEGMARSLAGDAGRKENQEPHQEKETASRAPDQTAESRSREPTMKASMKVLPLCAIEAGPYTAVVLGRHNPDSETWTYRAALLAEGTLLLDPMLKHEVAGVLRRVEREGGGEWLAVKEISQGLRAPPPGDHNTGHFKNALVASEVLIGVFAERGHEAALQDKGLGKELERLGEQALKGQARINSQAR